ncbi:MAG: hypothetical protein Kow0010_12110 [Dehalococcoidia bacterium]
MDGGNDAHESCRAISRALPTLVWWNLPMKPGASFRVSGAWYAESAFADSGTERVRAAGAAGTLAAAPVCWSGTQARRTV